ncbi:MAG: hypothetical protein WCA15_22035 [Candidatus Acidiferrales bacterium]
MRGSTLLGLSLCIVFAAVPAISQELPVGSVRAHIEGIAIPPIAGVPFTAKVVVTWNKPLLGGGTVSKQYYTLVARDSQGRVRRETRQFVSADSTAEPPLRSFTISDPVAGTRTTCTKAWRTCSTSTFDANLVLSQDDADGGNGSGQSLGQRTIEGLPVTGTRVTASNVSGAGAGSRIAISNTDAWYSPDLHIDLSVTRSDPQSGVVTLNVTDLVQGEPDPSWFAVPSGYTVRGGKTQ